VVAFSQFACASTRDVADVILPIGALPEIDATLTNLDGREQSARAGGGKLPGEAREGWRVLRALGGDMAWPVSTSPTWPACVPAWPRCRSPLPLRRSRGCRRRPGSGFDRRDLPHRCGGPSRPALQSHPLNNAPRIVLNAEDAARLQLQEGQMAKVGTDAGARPPCRWWSTPASLRVRSGLNRATARPRRWVPLAYGGGCMNELLLNAVDPLHQWLLASVTSAR
jgi:NADH-quinone oxidoreductase subunit G